MEISVLVCIVRKMRNWNVWLSEGGGWEHFQILENWQILRILKVLIPHEALMQNQCDFLESYEKSFKCRKFYKSLPPNLASEWINVIEMGKLHIRIYVFNTTHHWSLWFIRHYVLENFLMRIQMDEVKFARFELSVEN